MTDLELEVGPVAHGGHCVARADGRVVFVRHALPGERVVARITEERKDFLRADAVEVLDASPDRVEPPCPFARPDACGGCDFQHAAPSTQLALKAAVLEDQLKRLGKLDIHGVRVERLDDSLLGWRTRVQYAVSADGRLGFHKHRSGDVVPIDYCRIAHPSLRLDPAGGPPGGVVEAVVSGDGDVTVLTRQSRMDRHWTVVSGPDTVRETVHGRRWTVDAAAFWQVHPAAAAVFTSTVLDMLRPQAGERLWDLYGGAGLFAAALAPHCGPVTVVEADRRAVLAGQHALSDLPNVRFVRGDVARVLATNKRWRSVDLVVLDPPRAGAGRAVVRSNVERSPRAIAYVACDPAALARDLATFASHGYSLTDLRAFDAFPMTAHVECVALLVPA